MTCERAGEPAGGRRRVLVAPDKFKGSLTAAQVASAVARGLLRERPELEVDLCPVADGGDGTLDAAVRAGFMRVTVRVAGPTGEPLAASYAERDGVALVELAEAVGLRRLPEGHLAPMTASTYGAGQLVDAAIAAGNRTVILAIGGSSSTDGGAGLVQALGAGLFDDEGGPVGRGGAALARVSSVDLSRLAARVRGIRFVVASDVDNPLLGPDGAAAMFGPQKGASPEQAVALEAALARWAAVVGAATGSEMAGLPGAGAAGGVGFGAMALLDASLVPGGDVVLDMVGFAARLREACLVITGEGSIDAQTLRGKAPAKVALAAMAAGVPAVAIAGICDIPDERLAAIGISRVYCLADLEPDRRRSMAEAALLAERTGEAIARSEIG